MTNSVSKISAKRVWTKPEVKAVTPVKNTRGGLLASTVETAPVYMTS